jgi:hypothetical protein
MIPFICRIPISSCCSKKRTNKNFTGMCILKTALASGRETAILWIPILMNYIELCMSILRVQSDQLSKYLRSRIVDYTPKNPNFSLDYYIITWGRAKLHGANLCPTSRNMCRQPNHIHF